MEKIFYAESSAFPNSICAVQEILSKHFGVSDGKIARTECGKPYLLDSALFFSLSHTKEKLFVAFSKENVGVDAEPLSREPNIPLLLKKFPAQEREEIQSKEDFLKHWTAKEAAVKWLGGTLAHDLQKLAFIRGRLLYGELELPVFVTHLLFEGHVLSVCSEKDFSTTQFILA